VSWVRCPRVKTYIPVKCGRARNSTRLFYLHHTRLIAKAAVINDAIDGAFASRSIQAPAPERGASLRRARGCACERLALEGPPLHRVRG
jgi:hypothetical protein